MQYRKSHSITNQTAEVFKGHWLAVHEVSIRGIDAPYEMVVIPDYVSALVWRPDGAFIKVLLCRVCRPAAGTLWEPVEGIIASGESAEDTVIREIAEEAGVSRGHIVELKRVGAAYKATERAVAKVPVVNGVIAATTSQLYLVQVMQSTRLGKQHLDPEERIQPVWMNIKDAFNLVRAEGREHGLNPLLLLLLHELNLFVMAGVGDD